MSHPSDDINRRTEPTLDDPQSGPTSAASPATSAASAPLPDSGAPATRSAAAFAAARHGAELPPVPPPQADHVIPPTGRARPLNFLRWTLASVLTLAVSAALGLALLLAPGGTSRLIDASALAAWLPDWAGKPLAHLAQPPAPAAAPSATALPQAGSEPDQPAAADNATLATARETAPVHVADAADAADAAADAAPAATPAAVPVTAAPVTTLPPSAEAARPLASTEQASDARTSAPLAGVADKATPKTAKRPPTVAVVVAAPVTPAARGEERAIRAAPARSIFIQHASLASRAEAQAWQARHRRLNRARVIAVNTRNKGVKYAVVSGPFTTRKQAEAFAAQDGVASTPWYRAQPALLAALPPERR